MGFNTINLEKLNLKTGAKVLDLGCGLGRHSLLLYRDYPVDVYGLDLGFDDLLAASERKVDIEQQECKGKLIFVQADGYKIPFPDGSFDAVICSEVLEHVPDYNAMLAELIRVLKDESLLAISVPKYLPEKVCWLLSRQYPAYAGHVRIFKGNQLPGAVEEHRFMDLEQKHSSHALHSPYWWLRSLFFDMGEEFSPVAGYKSIMNWQLEKQNPWFDKVESVLNPVLGKSNVYYFRKAL